MNRPTPSARSGRASSRGARHDEIDPGLLLSDVHEQLPEGHRSGMIGLVGRPNVGKSTLVNQFVGQKVAIVTPVPGTTRNAIRAVVTRDDAQLVFLDTPGLSKPRTLLARRLNALVRDSWQGVDVLLFVVDIAAGIGPGDRYLASELATIDTPIVAVANKIDVIGDKRDLLPRLTQLEALAPTDRPFREIVPVSAHTGDNVGRLVDVLVDHLTPGPRWFAAGQVTDQPERQLAAELLREQLIVRAREELPHSIAVVIDEVVDADNGVVHVDAVIHVERDSQKGIVIGRSGANLKEASSAARQDMERLFGAPVYLSTHVKVTKGWQRDPKALGRLGY